jgi:pimeloyl-ACP methyl ester carboxylesterase
MTTSSIKSSDSSKTLTAKPVLVFVHGYLGGSLQWSAQVEAFSEYFTIITPDLPGYGLNNKLESPETIGGYADYVLDEISKQGVDKFHLLGHSMGGMIVQEMIARAPERVNKLILYGTGPIGVMPGRFEPIDESKQRLINEGVESSARRISAKWFVGGVDSPVYPGCADIAVLASSQAAIAGLSAMQAWSGKAALDKISAPTLVLWGDQDQSYLWPQPESLWRTIPNASLSVVPGCSHEVHLEKPALFNAILLDFLMS